MSDGDENYAVISLIKRKDSDNTGGITELSPEDTDKYKEEVNQLTKSVMQYSVPMNFNCDIFIMHED